MGKERILEIDQEEVLFLTEMLGRVLESGIEGFISGIVSLCDFWGGCWR